MLHASMQHVRTAMVTISVHSAHSRAMASAIHAPNEETLASCHMAQQLKL